MSFLRNLLRARLDVVEARIDIPAPPSEVFAFLCDPVRMAKMSPGSQLDEVTDLPGGLHRTRLHRTRSDGVVVHVESEGIERVLDTRTVVRTRQWIEETAGKTYVTQATSYQGGGTGDYAETRSAEVREVAGVDWRDLQSLIEGEAIILFGGRRIYAKLFHAEIDTRGPMRLNRPVALAPPDVESLKATSEHVGAVLKALEGGLGTGRPKRSATLAAMLGAFQDAAAAGRGVKPASRRRSRRRKIIRWRATRSRRWRRTRRSKPC